MRERFKHELGCSEASQEIREKVKAIWMKLAHRKAMFEIASERKLGTLNTVLGYLDKGASRCVSHDTAL